MSINGRLGRPSIKSASTIRTQFPKIEELLSLGCGRKRGWGNNCYIRHMCFRCQSLREYFSNQELVEMILYLEKITEVNMYLSYEFQSSYRDVSSLELIEWVQRLVKTA